MIFASIADFLWGRKAKFSYLLLASVILLTTFLGAREIWTQEHRWADIVTGMLYRHDYLHPYLGENTYYDKPLLSYWLIILFGKVTGQITTWALRMPSVLAGITAIWSIYQLGTKLKSKELGLMSGWMLLTTFYFVFWARTSSADMLNVGGTLLALAWYFTKRDRANFFDYSIFFIIVALTSLCKGLVGAIIPLIAVFTDICLQKSWRQHFRAPLFLALIPAAIIYVLPFWASSHFGGESYGQSGLYLVYRENILRYFQPFDHQGPIYTYFIYLPLYLMPWTVFFIPALYALVSRWKSLSINSKWIAWTLLLVFLFFTLSGSRRSYYVLPIVPFAILFTADWLLTIKRDKLLAAFTLTSFLLLFLSVDLVPAWYYSQFGVNRFAVILQHQASQIKPWNEWQVVMLDAESKLNFYLQLPPTTKHYSVLGTTRDQQTSQSLAVEWPILLNKPKNTIFISRKEYMDQLQPYFVGYQMLEVPTQTHLPFMQHHNDNAPIAFIPSQ